jgi:hypothetical protein
MTVTRPLARYFSRNGKQRSGDRKDSTFTSCLPPTNYATLTLRRSRVRGVWWDAGPAFPTEIVLGVHDAAALRAVDRTVSLSHRRSPSGVWCLRARGKMLSPDHQRGDHHNGPVVECSLLVAGRDCTSLLESLKPASPERRGSIAEASVGIPLCCPIAIHCRRFS